MRFSHHCAECEFDVCRDCFEPHTTPLHEHPLVKADSHNIYARFNGGRRCDHCDSVHNSPTDNNPWHCVTCDYDLCDNCMGSQIEGKVDMKKTKQKHRLKDIEKRSSEKESDMMDACTERPVKEEVPVDAKGSAAEVTEQKEVDEEEETEEFQSEEETWEDKEEILWSWRDPDVEVLRRMARAPPKPRYQSKRIPKAGGWGDMFLPGFMRSNSRVDFSQIPMTAPPQVQYRTQQPMQGQFPPTSGPPQPQGHFGYPPQPMYPMAQPPARVYFAPQMSGLQPSQFLSWKPCTRKRNRFQIEDQPPARGYFAPQMSGIQPLQTPNYQEPRRRKRKIIQIKDPSSNKDVTPEILAGGHSSDPSVTGSTGGTPNTTPDVSGHSSSSSTPPLTLQQQAEANVRVQFAALAANVEEKALSQSIKPGEVTIKKPVVKPVVVGTVKSKEVQALPLVEKDEVITTEAELSESVNVATEVQSIEQPSKEQQMETKEIVEDSKVEEVAVTVSILTESQSAVQLSEVSKADIGTSDKKADAPAVVVDVAEVLSNEPEQSSSASTGILTSEGEPSAPEENAQKATSKTARLNKDKVLHGPVSLSKGEEEEETKEDKVEEEVVGVKNASEVEAPPVPEVAEPATVEEAAESKEQPAVEPQAVVEESEDLEVLPTAMETEDSASAKRADGHEPELKSFAVSKNPVEGSIPVSILARGEKEQAAYRRAVKFGWTLDKRVKVLLVGQDRVGKTSVGRTLKGEKFNENEPSTDGVQMNKPLKNVGQQAWQNSELHRDTSAYDHKCAELVIDLTRSRDQSVEEPTEESTAEPTNKSKSEQNKQTTQELPNTPAKQRLKGRIMETPAMDKKKGTAESKIFNIAEHVPEQEEDIVMPDQVARLVENGRQEEKTDSGEGIWPVIWDFAGQAVYRAIHPIFLSPDIVYILVFDLRKKLSAKARCYVKQDGRDEKEIQTSDYNDTNLDHIMRWMDLVHSFKTVPKGFPHVAFPPVIIVGTHADSKDVNHNEKMDILMEKFRDTVEFEKHIAGMFVVDNTRAGQPKDQEDPAAKDLRDLILREANKMPYTKDKVPLQWLAVENKIREPANQRLKYVTKRDFKEKIANGICRFKDENDIEVLLHFLHDRGSILYHDRADNADGLVVLDPQWLTKVLCEILKVEPKDRELPIISHYRENLKTKGILAKELLDHACSQMGLDDIKDYLLYLMKKFNLLCSYKGKDEEIVYLVPCMATAKPDKETVCTSSTDLPPLFLTFKTKYVPCGLFPRLVSFFAEWAKLKCRSQPRLYANEAIFRVGKVHCLGFSCYKSVIKFFIWTQDDSDPLEKEQQLCLEVLRSLKGSLDKLCKECHWLHSCSWDLCIQCNMCQEIPDTKSGNCYWHDKKECFHDDCAHYVDIPLNSEPLCCDKLDNKRDARLPGREKFEPWIEAFTKLWGAEHQEKPGSEQIETGLPSLYELHHLAQDVCSSWKALGRELGITDADIKEIEADNPRLYEQCYSMLKRWRHIQSSPATYMDLTRALQSKPVDRGDLAAKYCSVSGAHGSREVCRPVVDRQYTVKDGEPTKEEISNLAQRVQEGNWKKLGRALKLEDSDMCEIDHNRKEDLYEKSYAMLSKWKQVNGPDATYRDLAEGLERVGRRDLIREFCCA